MAFRSFMDSAGAAWQVWDIVPVLSERRGEERRDSGAGQRSSGPERRQDERRIAATRRLSLSGSFATGWLCFESKRERRRLSPIPADWKSCDQRGLERYLNHATPVPNARNARGIPFADSSDDSIEQAG
jgi:hypothetical protein